MYLKSTLKVYYISLLNYILINIITQYTKVNIPYMGWCTKAFQVFSVITYQSDGFSTFLPIDVGIINE